MAGRKLDKHVFANSIINDLSEQDRAFVILIALGGVSASTAYRLIYPTNANGNSVSVLASKKLTEPRLQDYARWLWRYYSEGSIRFNEKTIKH